MAVVVSSLYSPPALIDLELSRTTRVGLGLTALGFAGAFAFPSLPLKLVSLGVSGVGVAFIADVFRGEDEEDGKAIIFTDQLPTITVSTL